MTNNEELLQQIRELNQKRTQGDWFWSSRTLRSDIHDDDGDIVETVDIILNDRDMCRYTQTTADGALMAILPQVAELCLSQADELKAKDAENARLREALEWIVGYDGNQYTTRKAQQALSDGGES